MAFNRWTLGWDRTWAYRLFKGHHTELNAIYWANQASLRYAFSATRGKKKTDLATTIFTLPPADATRLKLTLGDWAHDYSEFDNWMRLSCLVAITGYLEVYLKTVCRLALESCPALLIGGTKEIDGLKLLKSRPKYDYSEEVISCVKGTWPERISAYERLFGTSPAILNTSIKKLEVLRKARNGTSHAFGRGSDDYNELCEIKPKRLKRISEEKLKEYLALADKVAFEIDKHLGLQFIGEYESLYFFHKWDRKYPKGHMTMAKALQEAMAKKHGRTLSITYSKDLIAYYDKA